MPPQTNDSFPDIELPDHRNTVRCISSSTKLKPLDKQLGSSDSCPVIVFFNWGFFCPKDQEQLRQLTSDAS